MRLHSFMRFLSLLLPGSLAAQNGISLTTDSVAASFYSMTEDIYIDEHLLENDNDNSQAISILNGAANNVYYNTASYNFGPMHFKYRGYSSPYTAVYVNGIEMNDLITGSFDYTSLGGMTSRAFRNKTTVVGMDAATYGFGAIGGATNYNTSAMGYAPGFAGSLAFTNSSYMLRAMATYSTGISKDGWGITVSGIGRWSDEGVVPGTFYKQGGLFVSVGKIFNARSSLTFTAYGAPLQRATSSPTYAEIFELTGDNLYNPNWGWQDGKKRSARIRQQFDPTFMANWLFQPTNATTINAGAMFRVVNYSQSRIERYKAPDPMPDYYKKLPSYYSDSPATEEFYDHLWHTDDSFRQIDWASLYQANYLNRLENLEPENADNQKGSSYILEDRHSDRQDFAFNSSINHRFNNTFSLQGGLSFFSTKGSYFKTVRDLLGGDYWLDIETFSDQYMAVNPDLIQNDLDHPNRKVGLNDRFGYNYDIRVVKTNAWLQNMISLPRWDIFYAIKFDFNRYQRYGYMRSGRDPLHSAGRGPAKTFVDPMIKAGVTYKLDGRNAFSAHGEMGSRAPLAEDVYLSPRYRAAFINDPESERILSGDISYTWNYRNFRGYLGAYATVINNGTERTTFYDDDYRSNVYYILQNVKRVYKGIEVGAAYKILPSLTATVAGTYSRSQYKNNPTGTRVIDNGQYADVSNTVYLRNYFVGSTPQAVGNIGLDWAAPNHWFFNINGTWMGDSYVTLSPRYHEAIPDLWTLFPNPDELEAQIRKISEQEKLRDAFVLNLSVGKLVYINRKYSLNFNLSVNNVLNNRNIITYAYEQSRLRSDSYDRSQWPSRYMYAQGIRLFFNVGIKF